MKLNNIFLVPQKTSAYCNFRNGKQKKGKKSREGLFEELQLVKEIWDNFHFFVPKIPEIAGAESNRYMYIFGKKNLEYVTRLFCYNPLI